MLIDAEDARYNSQFRKEYGDEGDGERWEGAGI